jgi:ABC-type antimicrobial peptide transport system permease subunit
MTHLVNAIRRCNFEASDGWPIDMTKGGWRGALGVLVGSALSGGAFVALGLGLASAAPLLLAVAAIMAIVGLMAALGPARRGLRIQAIEALRADA